MHNIAVFWDESHLWGILLWQTLRSMGINPQLLSGGLIREGVLQNATPDMLLVPGGWARLKSLSLGEGGRENIRKYIRDGGRYLGICGGTGLALASEGRTPLLDLCSWSRKPARERLPNFSGHLRCSLHMEDMKSTVHLPVWWPSQFAPDPQNPLEIMACYEEPGPDFWSADLNWSGISAEEASEWEALYGINLNPERLRGEPCVVRGTYGRGEFILSYPHLETPASPEANALLAHLINAPRKSADTAWALDQSPAQWDDPHLAAMQTALEDLIDFGQSHFLLSWRKPWLLGWRRGVPGSPINFLLGMVWQVRHTPPTDHAQAYWHKHKETCRRICIDFCRKVKAYLLMERRVLAVTPSSPESSASDTLQGSKVELFGQFPGYGGVYGELLHPLDSLLRLQLASFVT